MVVSSHNLQQTLYIKAFYIAIEASFQAIAIPIFCVQVVPFLYIQIPYASHAEQVHGKFALCFSSSLNSSRDLHSFNFNGRWFHKTLPL